MDDDLIARAARLGLCDEETARLKLGRDPAMVRVLVEKGILRRQDLGALLRPDVEAAARRARASFSTRRRPYAGRIPKRVRARKRQARHRP